MSECLPLNRLQAQVSTSLTVPSYNQIARHLAACTCCRLLWC